MANDTKVIHNFFLLGLQGNKSINILLFIVFLTMYVITLIGDFLIAILVTKSYRLQSPMFYFLKYLSISEFLFITNIIPNMLYVILKGGGFMSLAGCIIQSYLYSSLGTMESLLLSVMSYDRYLAICNPLHYANVMNLQFCQILIFASGLLSLTCSLIIIVLFCELKFCGSNVITIDHYICDLAPLMDLSCSDTTSVRIVTFLFAVSIVVSMFSFIIWTYLRIFISIFRISSIMGRQKAFSTCSAHLSSVCSLYGTLIITYLVPNLKGSVNYSKILSIFYTVVNPLFNPLIYSLRNEGIRHAFWRLLKS